MSILFLIFLSLSILSLSYLLISFPLEKRDVWLKVISGVLAGMTVMVGFWAFFTSEELSDLQKERIATLENSTAEAKQKQAEAELALKSLGERQQRQESPRWAYLSPLYDSLKGKATGIAEILYVGEDDEALTLAIHLASSMEVAGWKIIRRVPISADDPSQILSQFARPDTPNLPLITKVGGQRGITLVVRKLTSPPFDERNAADVLTGALLKCGFSVRGSVDEGFPDDLIRIVIGAKE